ncbi:MAG TPA: universal stress protein [Gemmatimonadales bacterium]
MDKRILVPLDGSRFAEAALPLAMTIAASRQTGLELTTVYEDQPTVAGWSLSPEQHAASLRTYLETVAGHVAAAATIKVDVALHSGQPAEVLLHRTGRADIDLVVMATHGRGTIHRAWLGSVADDVIRHATVPVVVVRPGDEATTIAPHGPIDRVVIALDGSKRAERGIRWAMHVAGSRAQYILLRVVPGPILGTSTYLPHAIKETGDAIRQGAAEAGRYLEDVARGYRVDGLAIRTEVVTGVPSAAGILRFVEREPVDLVTITTHGHGGLRRLLLGSVADKVVRGASGPLLIAQSTDA